LSSGELAKQAAGATEGALRQVRSWPGSFDPRRLISGGKMVGIELVVTDPMMPRTEFWDEALRALSDLARAASGQTDQTLNFPAEDVAMETNWPRYARAATAYTRGVPHSLNAGSRTVAYLHELAAWCRDHPDQTLLVINMHPFFRLPLSFSGINNLIVADGCLSAFDRSVNPRTISMPALPLCSSRAPKSGLRRIRMSFQGVESHPIRTRLAGFHNGDSVRINLIPKSRHNDLRLDATRRVVDEEYLRLLDESMFALVPRGDALFSYRLLEVMSFGCIPIILSDGWILPFDRIISWDSCAYKIHADALDASMNFLMSVSDEEMLRRQARVLSIYREYFADIKTMISTLILEAIEIGIR
jgi:hypothetical protein